jgi:hypothetical protein
LTPGDFEVDSAALAADRSFVIFSANKNDIDRRHLWRVDVGGGAPQEITRGESIEMYPVVFDGGRQVAFFHSTARDPFMPFTARIDGSNMNHLRRKLCRETSFSKACRPTAGDLQGRRWLGYSWAIVQAGECERQDAGAGFHAWWTSAGRCCWDGIISTTITTHMR